jgi:SulP family sulfate permease
MSGDAEHDGKASEAGGSDEHGARRDGARGFLHRYLPISRWLPSYRREWFSGDAVSAISVWALLVPQSLAYSSIAGVPVQYGLYAAFASLVAYAVFGTSRQLVQGPSAAVAAVSAAAILPIVGSDAMGTDDAVAITAALAITTGIVYLLLGVARMGWVSNFLSKAVMSGFVLGFSIGIIIDQSHKLLGVDSVDGSYWEILVGTIQEIPDTNTATLILGSISLAALLAMRRFTPRLPRALIVMVLSIIAVTALDLTAHGVAVTGTVPTGLFSIGIPFGSWDQQGALLVGALSIIFVGYSETLAAGRAMATKHAYEIDPDQELIAEGFACLGSGLVGSFATDGSLSKTSVADSAGQKSQMASLVNAVFVLLTMLFLAGLFENLADAVLGAVVIDAMVGLITLADFKRYRRVNRADWACFMAAGLGIVFLSITAGIAVGVVLSLLLLISRASGAQLHRLGRTYDAVSYRDISRHDDVVVDPDVLVVRLDGPLFFANANRFHDQLTALLAGCDPEPKIVVADMEAVAETDTDGADSLTRLAQQLRTKGGWFGLARVKGSVLDSWKLAGAIDDVGSNRVFADVHEAVEAGRASVALAPGSS